MTENTFMVEWEYEYSTMDSPSETRTTGQQFGKLEDALQFIKEKVFGEVDWGMNKIRIFKLNKLEVKLSVNQND